MSEAEIEAVDDPSRWGDVYDEPTIAALELADSVSTGSQSIAEELVGRLRAHFDEAALAELIVVIGHANFNNRVGNAAEQVLGPEPERTTPDPAPEAQPSS